MNKIPLVDLKAQYIQIQPEINEAIQRVLDNTSFILGHEVAEFEQAFADFVGAGGAVGVASGTGALRLAIQACGLEPGEAVITPAHTFFATGEAISQLGGRPLFVDIDEQSYNLDPAHVEDTIKAYNGDIRGIIPVHLYGQPADMDPLLDIANRHNLWVIEDAAQAHGAEYKGKRCGTLGHLACFSFYPGKNLGAYGDAGMVTGNDQDLLDRVHRLRNHGRTDKYEHQEIGWGERIDALQAAILAVKLRHLEAWTEARRRHANRYRELLQNTKVITPYAAPNMRHVYHLYVIRVASRRDELLTFLKKNGIGAGMHYPLPLHRQPAYLAQGYDRVHLPVTERIVDEIISLPLYPELSEAQIHHVVQTIKEFLNG